MDEFSHERETFRAAELAGALAHHNEEQRQAKVAGLVKALAGLVLGGCTGVLLGDAPKPFVIAVMVVLALILLYSVVATRPGRCIACGKLALLPLPGPDYRRRGRWDVRFPSRKNVTWACGEHLPMVATAMVRRSRRDS